MATMNVSLPDPMKAYVRDLIRRDQQDREQIKALQAAITKGLESGISDRTMQDIVKEARSKAKAAKHAL